MISISNVNKITLGVEFGDQIPMHRSSHGRCSLKKLLLKFFCIIHRRTPVLEFLFNKVAGLRPGTLLKKTPTQVFSCEYWEISKNTYFIESLLNCTPCTPTCLTHHWYVSYVHARMRAITLINIHLRCLYLVLCCVVTVEK